MVKNVAFQDDGILAISSWRTVPCKPWAAWASRSGAHAILSFFASIIKQVKEVPNLMCHIFSALKVIDISQ